MRPLLLAVAFLVQDPVSGAYLKAYRAADAALVAGRLDDARTGYERCLQLTSENENAAYGLACARARSGETSAALEWLDQAVSWGWADGELALWDEDLASLRHETRFTAALERMRAAAAEREPARALVQIGDTRKETYPVEAAVDPAGRRVAVGDASGFVAILDARTGTEQWRSQSLGSPVWSVAFHPGGELLAALTWDGAVHVLEVDASAPARTFAALPPDLDEEWSSQREFGAFVQFDPTGERLLAASRARGASLWAVAGQPIRKWKDDFVCDSRSLAWSPDGKTLAAIAGRDAREVRILDGRTGAPSGPALVCPSTTHCVAFAPDGNHLATGHADARMRLWLLEPLELVWASAPIESMFGVQVNSVRFSNDGRRVACSTGGALHAAVFDSQSGEEVWSDGPHGGRIREPAGLCWSDDGERLWFAFESGAMQVWEARLGEPGSARAVARGRPPRSRGGIAAITSWTGVAGLDTATGRWLWHRVAHEREGRLEQVPEGYFTTDLVDLEGLRVQTPTASRAPIDEVLELLFDPKRVRAARAGVALTPVRLSEGGG